MRKPKPREHGEFKACNSIQTNWPMRDPRIEIQDTGQHILKVLYNTWYITDVALQNSGSSLDHLINGAERNDYPYGKNEIGSLLHTVYNNQFQMV